MTDQLDDHLRRVAEDGFTILEDVIEPSLIDAISSDLERLEVELGIVPADNLFEGVRTVRIYNLLVHGPTFESIPVHSRVLPVVEGVLDPGLLISSLSSIAIGPDEAAQMLHADDQLIPLPRPHVPIICNTMWAITDFTEANGATRLVARTSGRTHRATQRTASRFPRRCRRAACSSGWAASGTGAGQT
jgi:ectoine hydroxylase-related dioxygenase (phytanoyl-CoA dioxygenase family)